VAQEVGKRYRASPSPEPSLLKPGRRPRRYERCRDRRPRQRAAHLPAPLPRSPAAGVAHWRNRPIGQQIGSASAVPLAKSGGPCRARRCRRCRPAESDPNAEVMVAVAGIPPTPRRHPGESRRTRQRTRVGIAVANSRRPAPSRSAAFARPEVGPAA
jgi:hypothetical protein